MRNQTMQRELNSMKYNMRSLDKKSQFSLSALAMTAGHVQKICHAKLAAKHKHALINNDDYAVANFIVNHIENIVVDCCQNGATVEEGLKKATDSSQFSMEQVKKLIADQPSKVRLSWSKNTISGFITACQMLCSSSVEKDTPEESEESAA